MLKTSDEKVVKSGYGIIVGRFQVPELHDGHKELIQSVINRHNKVFIVLGLSEVKCTKTNPLDFQTRKSMIEKVFPEVDVYYVKDQPMDEVWSRNLDDVISTHCAPTSGVTLYGSRDSFIDYYHGRYDVKILEPDTIISGTETRDKLKEMADKKTRQFREGVIWATQNQYPTVHPTVDIAIIKDDGVKKLLLGRKPNENKYRFIGGFVDPTETVDFESGALEYNARREVLEETGLEVDELSYVGSFFINDWRYRSEVNKIMTTFFVGKYIYGFPKANDDICELKWFELDKVTSDDIVDTHSKLFDNLKKYLNK